jgi:iron(III) transport system ATP-binding protein
MIRLEGVSRAFEGIRAVSGISLEIADRERLVVSGPNGSGKTTLLRLIAGLEVPDAGTIRFGDRQVSGPGWAVPPSLRGVGMVFQSPALWPHMTVAGNIRFGIPPSDPGAGDRVSVLLSRAGIPHLGDRYPHQLSGGEARRVAILRAIAPSPRILLMDEPLTHLDPEVKIALQDLVREVVAAGQMTLVCVTHDPQEAATQADRVIRLQAGRVEGDGVR